MKLYLNIFPPAQYKLWPLLKDVPSNYILYGGTAIALQLGHRISVDFDFFADNPLNKNELLNSFPLLNQHPLIQPEMNTIDSFIELPEGVVKLQFLAGLSNRQKRVDPPLIAKDNQVRIASLRDLLATKLNTIQQRAECKDYRA
jgi:predicted nucleotidyltransferase component of viral defense system